MQSSERDAIVIQNNSFVFCSNPILMLDRHGLTAAIAPGGFPGAGGLYYEQMCKNKKKTPKEIHESMKKKYPLKTWRVENGRKCIKMLRYIGHGVFCSDTINNPTAAPYSPEIWDESTSLDLCDEVPAWAHDLYLQPKHIPCNQLCCSSIIWLEHCRAGLAIKIMRSLADACPGKRITVYGCKSSTYQKNYAPYYHHKCPGGYHRVIIIPFSLSRFVSRFAR